MYYFGAGVIQLPVLILLSPIYAKILSSNDFASLGYFTAISMFILPVFNFSFYNYYMTNYNNDDINNSEILQTLISFLLVYSIGVAIPLYYGLKYYLYYSNSSINIVPLGIIIIMTGATSIGIGFWKIDLRFKRESKNFFLLSLSVVVLNAILGLLFIVFFKLGALGKLLPLFLINFSSLLIFIKIKIKKFKINPKILKNSISFCYPLVFSALISSIIFHLDRVYVEQINNTEEYALYNISYTISTYVGFISVAVLQAIEPDIFKFVAKRQKTNLIVMFSLFLIIVALIIILFNLFSGSIISYLTAGRYLGAQKYSMYMVAIKLQEQIIFFLGFIIISLKMTKISLLNKVIASITMIILYSKYINIYGYIGALYIKLFVFTLWIILQIVEIYNYKLLRINKI